MKLTLLSALFLSFAAVPSLAAEPAPASAPSRTLVVYYSLSGNTEAVATALAAELGADLRRIEEPKKRSMLGAYVGGGYAATKGKSSTLKEGTDYGLTGYERIFVGTPVWAASPTPAINAFIDNADFTGTKVVTFATMGGSDPGKTFEKMKERIEKKGGAVVGSFAFKSGGVSKEQLAAQAKEEAGKYR